jgi:hypothetical protein
MGGFNPSGMPASTRTFGAPQASLFVSETDPNRGQTPIAAVVNVGTLTKDGNAYVFAGWD